ncbi:MAG: crosslink repair DNA glycosylase YcaQ family protein [Pirellulales bacterium]
MAKKSTSKQVKSSPTKTAKASQVNSIKLQGWWWHRQGLDGSIGNSDAADTLARCGWARSVAGVGPYITLFARNGASRNDVDDAVAKAKIHELPAARNCTYVVPEIHYALALRAGQDFSTSEMKTAMKLGVTEKEIERLCDAVLKCLKGRQLDPAAIRTATGDLSRSLGEEGKKKGVTTTLPIALGKLQTEGLIRRVPIDGRLDQQRYLYTAWSPGPLKGFKLSQEQVFKQLAELYFRWIGPATLGEFQWFSGLGVKAAKAAVEGLSLCPIDSDGTLLLLEEDMEEFEKFKPDGKPDYQLLSSLDSITTLRRNVVSLLHPDDADRPLPIDRMKEAAGALSDLPCHAIFDRGRLIGLWEYDYDKAEIVTFTFVKQDKHLKAKIDEMSTYIQEQVGDARSFSLDSPKSRQGRIADLRALSK